MATSRFSMTTTLTTPSFLFCGSLPALYPSTFSWAYHRASLQQSSSSLAACASTSGVGWWRDGVKLESGPLLQSGRDEDKAERRVEADDEEEELWSRRGLMGASALTVVANCLSFSCEPAQAFSLGISGPKDWLREQKRKTAQFLLNPIEASRNRLNSAVLLLSSAEGSSFENYEEAGRLVKIAARDCTPVELGSVLDFQSRTGVEVCTFKLVLKNAASLLDDKDPVKLRAGAALDDLIRSFVVVDGLLTRGGASAATQREDVMGALNQTMEALDTFQRGVQNCLNA